MEDGEESEIDGPQVMEMDAADRELWRERQNMIAPLESFRDMANVGRFSMDDLATMMGITSFMVWYSPQSQTIILRDPQFHFNYNINN